MAEQTQPKPTFFRRPRALIGALSAGYLLMTLSPAIAIADEYARHPAEALAQWGLVWALTVPLAAVAASLARRLQALQTGQAAGWRPWFGLAFGALGAGHWFTQLLWSPALLLNGLISSYRREDQLLGAVLGLVAWAAFGGCVALLWRSRLGSAEETTIETTRVPTMWLLAGLYGVLAGVPSLVMGFAAVGGREPGAVAVIWTVASLACPVFAAFGHWVSRPQLGGGYERFARLLGAVMIAHWLPMLAVCLAYQRGHHEQRLFSSLYASFAIVAATALWSTAAAYRLPAQ